MRIYAESSAVLRWLLSQDGATDVHAILKNADEIAASELTLIECDRALQRARFIGQITERDARHRQLVVNRVSEGWELLHMRGAVVERARGKFPEEPLRALDAIHLASALVWAQTGSVMLLSLDERIRRNAQALGLDVSP